MTERIEQVTQERNPDGTTVKTTKIIDDNHGHQPAVSKSNTAARIVWLVATIILALLAVRFVLVLLGANPNNGFADFIFSTSRPLVSPFFSLFNYDATFDSNRFEAFTLVAVLVYGFIAAIIARIVTIGKPAA